ncbi:MAG: uncharacterized protein JWM90_3066 [Thermoleophilia bacterium]|nr:uncharacterized protein [Thermoleophilia bacterium]
MLPLATTSAATMPIPHVQGSGASSSYLGTGVTVSGVVTGIQRTGAGAGFFLQDPVGDGDGATSDGLFVRMGEKTGDWQASIDIGTKALASGIVSERGGLTAIEVASKSGLQVQTRRASLGPLVPELLEVPIEAAARVAYLEAREGMLTTLPNALVVGPTNVYGQYVAVDADKHGPRRMFEGPDTTGFIHVNGKIGPKPQLLVGDRVEGMRGPLGVTNNAFEIQPVGNYKALERGARPPRAFGDIDGDDQFTRRDRTAIQSRVGTPAAGPLDPADLNADGVISRIDLNRFDARAKLVTGAPVVRIATLNAFNFFDSVDAAAPIDDDVLTSNEYRTKLAKLGGTIRDRLGSPELLALQEVENTQVLDDLLARPELQGLGYQYVLLPTNGRRSINPALLYRGDAVEIIGARQAQNAVPGGGEARIYTEPAQLSAVPRAAAPLFAREPLVVDVRLKDEDGKPAEELTLVVNHLVSKFSPHGLPTDDLRVEQANFLRGFVEDLRATTPQREVIVLGDLNDTEHSPALKALTGPKRSPTMVNASATLVPESERYSYVFDGKSELIDHVVVTPGLMDRIERAGVRHGNADLPRGEAWDSSPARASDHDSPYIWLRYGAAATTPTALAAATS